MIQPEAYAPLVSKTFGWERLVAIVHYYFTKEKHMKNIFRLLFVVCFLFTCANSLHAQWVRTSGPCGGYVDAFGVSGTNLFAGTGGDGVYLSTNNGTSWTQVNSGLPLTPTVTSFAVNGTEIFAGIDGNGVYLSTNNGSSWYQVNFGLTNMAVRSLAVSGTNLFAGTDGGVYRSTNNGGSWALVYSSGVNALAISNTDLFAGNSGGVLLSTDNGTSWTQVNSGLTKTYVQSLTVSPNGAGGTNLFAGSIGGVFLSTDNGTSWTSVNTGLTNAYINALVVASDGAGGNNIFAGTYGGGAFLSTDNGSSWTGSTRVCWMRMSIPLLPSVQKYLPVPTQEFFFRRIMGQAGLGQIQGWRIQSPILSLSAIRIFLPARLAAESFFRQTTVQVGLKLTQD